MEKRERLAAAYAHLRSLGLVHTQKELAQKIEAQESTISNALKGKEKYLTDKLLHRFNESFDSIFNIDWLLTGEGEMLNTNLQPANTEEPQLFTENKHGNRFYKRSDGQLFIEAPLVPYNALGSPDDEFSELIADRSRYQSVSFEADRVGHGRYFAFEVDGDSMDDGTRASFERGDIVLVRELDKDDWLPRLHISKWRFWVVCWGNCVRLKEIIAQSEGAITLHSLNPSPEYTDFVLRLSDVRRLFNVIKKIPRTVDYL